MLEGKYWYAYEKFSSAIHTLATGAGDVRSRLNDAYLGPLWVIRPEHLPEDLQEDLIWIKNKITKYKEIWPGQLEELKRFPHLCPNPVEATLRRIRRSTGAEIARRIFKIYDSLISRVID